MIINSNSRILTIGDGDLSFSASLLKNYQPKQITATIFDNVKQLSLKYGDEHYQTLIKGRCDVITEFDVTNRKSWGELKLHLYDVVIFQFPLIPAFTTKQEYQDSCRLFSKNTLNRRLLRLYLLNCFKYFLAEQGANLAFITSKSVKPYRQWNIESSLIMGSDINFIGRVYFDIK